jgi:hexosaminidase
LTAKDGHYTKQEFIDMQIRAEQSYVEIIPEIDVPAHSLAFTHYMPEIGSKEYGMDHLDLFNPKTYEFVDGLFREYLEGDNPVFRGKRVHIGTDEYSNAKKDVVEKFREFTDRYIRYVESCGKQAVCWGALTHAAGDTPVKSENVIMHCWYNGYANPRHMKEQGYQLVSIPDGMVYIVPVAGYYYDYLNCQYLYNNWTPAVIGGERFDEQDPSILGGMFAVWNDHPGNGIAVKDVHHRVFPAMQTLAVKCWTGALTQLPYEQFDKQRKELSEAPGVNELALYGTEQREVFACDEVKATEELPLEEIGYDYTISFTLEGVAEQKGTELFRSANAVFYLADPENGQFGFMRDGYLNKFNYRVRPNAKVEIKIQGTNKFTRLYVNGRLQQELGPITLYGTMEAVDRTYDPNQNGFAPIVYNPSSKMFYQHTLVFPLKKAGEFKSRITDLKVYNYLKQ